MRIQRFCGNQLRSKRYLVKFTDIYSALSSTLPSSCDKEEVDDDIPLLKSNDLHSEITPQNRSLSEPSNDSSLQEPPRRSPRIHITPEWLATSEMERTCMNTKLKKKVTPAILANSVYHISSQSRNIYAEWALFNNKVSQMNFLILFY